MVALGDLMARVLVAIILAPLVILAIYQDDPIWTWGVVFAASTIAMYEFFTMVLEEKVDRVVSVLLGACASASWYWLSAHGATPDRYGTELAIIITMVGPALYYLFRFGTVDGAHHKVSGTITGIVYAGILFTLLAVIRRDFGANWLMLILIIAFAGDTGAYFAGRFLGVKKLYAKVSPGKTWAGSIGGLCCSVGAAALVKIYLMGPDDFPLEWSGLFAIAIPGAIVGQMGDLFESLIKRSSGVKDSGGILGAHGGFLDRLDSVVFIAAYCKGYMIIRALW